MRFATLGVISDTERLILPTSECFWMPVDSPTDAGRHGERAVCNPVVDSSFADAEVFCSSFFGDEFVWCAHGYTGIQSGV